MTEVTVTLDKQTIALTPEILAKAFWEMCSEQQAQFFDKLAEVIQKDNEENPFAYGLGERQWCSLKDELKEKGMERANKMHMALSAFAFDFWPQKEDGARTGIK